MVGVFPYALELQYFLQSEFSLVQPAELVDLVLVFSSHLDLVCGFVLLGELQGHVSNCKAGCFWGGLFGLTMRRCIIEAMVAVIVEAGLGYIGSSAIYHKRYNDGHAVVGVSR